MGQVVAVPALPEAVAVAVVAVLLRRLRSQAPGQLRRKLNASYTPDDQLMDTSFSRPREQPIGPS